MHIDLNSDVGESFGAYTHRRRRRAHGEYLVGKRRLRVSRRRSGRDARTVRLARDAGVAIGAHPGFPDLVGFGRRELRASPREVEDMVVYQLGALAALARAEGMRLTHVKAHGALYNMAARDRALADAIARAVASVDPTLAPVRPAGIAAASRRPRRAGSRSSPKDSPIAPIRRTGRWCSRAQPGAVIHDIEEVVRRAMRLATEGGVTAIDGSELAMPVQTHLHPRRHAGRCTSWPATARRPRA